MEEAWENIEMARHIVTTHLSTPDLSEFERDNLLSLLVDCHTKLGSVESWNQHYERAIAEYKSAIGFLGQRKREQPRSKAEILFLIANSFYYKFTTQSFAESVRFYREGKLILEKIADGEKGEEAREELRGLIQQLQGKIEKIEEEGKVLESGVLERGGIWKMVNHKKKFEPSVFVERGQVTNLGTFGVVKKSEQAKQVKVGKSDKVLKETKCEESKKGMKKKVVLDEAEIDFQEIKRN